MNSNTYSSTTSSCQAESNTKRQQSSNNKSWQTNISSHSPVRWPPHAYCKSTFAIITEDTAGVWSVYQSISDIKEKLLTRFKSSSNLWKIIKQNIFHTSPFCGNPCQKIPHLIITHQTNKVDASQPCCLVWLHETSLKSNQSLNINLNINQWFSAFLYDAKIALRAAFLKSCWLLKNMHRNTQVYKYDTISQNYMNESEMKFIIIKQKSWHLFMFLQVHMKHKDERMMIVIVKLQKQD